ncbi:NUDIX hydrolase [Streptomyces sp. NPDC000927]|uniref:NUDIX hydrolase n=1 Tax=Streptomyces sp. NPDC000927 TaxID=3154371 RepID=UPI003326566C
MTEKLEVIRYTTDVVVARPDGHVLLIERKYEPHQGCWALPGGHVDPGEGSLHAAVRELEEEAGVSLGTSDLSLLGVWDAPNRDPRGRYVTVAYLAIVPEDTQAEAGSDARTVRWWPAGDLPSMAFDHFDILTSVPWRSLHQQGVVAGL